MTPSPITAAWDALCTAIRGLHPGSCVFTTPQLPGVRWYRAGSREAYSVTPCSSSKVTPAGSDSGPDRKASCAPSACKTTASPAGHVSSACCSRSVSNRPSSASRRFPLTEVREGDSLAHTAGTFGSVTVRRSCAVAQTVAATQKTTTTASIRLASTFTLLLNKEPSPLREKAPCSSCSSWL